MDTHPEQSSSHATAASAPAAFAAFIVVAAGSAAFCRLLLTLSGFGANPFPALPLAVVGLVGLLFAGALHPLARRLSRRGSTVAALAAGTVGLLISLPMPSWGGSIWYVLAPAIGVTAALSLRALPERAGRMLSAMSVYVVCTLLANYTFDSFLPVGEFFLVNVGTFFFGITFTQRDRVHRYGRTAVYTMIAFAAVANVALALMLGTPLRYVAVGFLAILLSETADTEIYQRLLRRRWLTRVASSNAVSAPLDTVLFTVLAFAGAPFATAGWMVQVIATDVIVKYASGMLAAFGILAGARAGRGPFEPDGFEPEAA